MKILAIDDSPTLRKFISKHLSTYSTHYQVLTAATASQGLEIARKELPDLILLDFILPDFNGDEVCRKLLDEEATAGIPVILMSSSAPDIERTEGEFKNIVRSMIKPFSPQLLCAGVSFVLKKDSADTPPPPPKAAELTDTRPVNPSTPPPPPDPLSDDHPTSRIAPSSPQTDDLLFAGRSDYFDLYDALRGIALEEATGTFLLDLATGQREVYVRNGLPHLVTTRSLEAYTASGQLDIPEESRSYFEDLSRTQQETGHPVFLQMGQDQAIPKEQARALTTQYGNFCFSEAWIHPPFFFCFYKNDSFPGFIPEEQAATSMDEWITETLRSVNAHSKAVKSISTPRDILSFTASGYEKIQKLSLSEIEVAFATEVGQGGVTIGEVASNLDLEWHEVSRILFLFVKTRTMDVWPAP